MSTPLTRLQHIQELFASDNLVLASPGNVEKIIALLVDPELAALRAQLAQSEEISKGLAASQCEDPISGEYGHMICGRVLELERQLAQVTREQVKIETRCPSCGNTTLFLSDHHELVCSWLGCKEPVPEFYIKELQHQLAEAQATIVQLVGLTRDPASCTHLWTAHTHGCADGSSDAVCTRCGWCPNQQMFFAVTREEGRTG